MSTINLDDVYTDGSLIGLSVGQFEVVPGNRTVS